MTRSLGALALLLSALVGCGGGNATPNGSSATAVAGLEEEETATTGAAKAAPAPADPSKIDPALIPEPGVPLVRESYSWAGGNRDPFASVLEGGSIGPELADLDLVAVYLQSRNPSASVAVLRDRVSGKNYTVREGERVGRARVADIPNSSDVVFTFDDYGTQRQVTLTLRKREETPP